MQIGLVGLPYTGKTTLFNALTGLSIPTGTYSEGQGEANRAAVAVPDERVDRLAEIYNPKKTTYAAIEYLDVGGFKKGASEESGVSAHLLGQLRDADALAIIVRVFEVRRTISFASVWRVAACSAHHVGTDAVPTLAGSANRSN